jgi:hypothetical protein
MTCELSKLKRHLTAKLCTDLAVIKIRIFKNYITVNNKVRNIGRAVAQAVSRWLPTATARIRV